MYLKKIILTDFKNIEAAQMEFSPKFNCITGNNGEGKTNLLDAVYFLSMTKSFFQLTDQQVVRHGAQGASINGTYVYEGDVPHSVAVGIKGKAEKQVKFDGKPYQRLSEHIGELPVVMVSPADASLIVEGGEARRRFLNNILSQTDREYLRCILSYNKLLAQRNRLLKDDPVQEDLLEVISEQMEPCAQYIFEARRDLCAELLPWLEQYYQAISSDKEKVTLSYSSDLMKGSLTELFAKDFERDKILRYTSSGIQRDEVEFELDGYPIKKFGSQGQQKSFLIALKLAQFALMRRKHGSAPVLLLDDLFDRLDSQRVEALLQLVSDEQFGQIFITDSNKVRIDSIIRSLGADSTHLSVSGGEFSTTD